MHIDCNACNMQATTACDTCIVPVLLHQMSGPFELGSDEAEAFDNLADAGLVAPLRLVPFSDDSSAAAG
ncbi:MAG: hypothetical protein GY926_21515 [bacterium]|nr:hypothetical protein [bacterium]MCP4967799.1 hypothetical protein [bacterium]